MGLAEENYHTPHSGSKPDFERRLRFILNIEPVNVVTLNGG
jgi:hypothetical protein